MSKSKLRLNREKGLEKLREEFGLKKQKSYADYLREEAEKKGIDPKSQIRKFNKKKGRVSKFNTM